jgi:hypothetical protein
MSREKSCIDGRTTLKWILEKQTVKMDKRFKWLREGSSGELL